MLASWILIALMMLNIVLLTYLLNYLQYNGYQDHVIVTILYEVDIIWSLMGGERERKSPSFNLEFPTAV